MFLRQLHIKIFQINNTLQVLEIPLHTQFEYKICISSELIRTAYNIRHQKGSSLENKNTYTYLLFPKSSKIIADFQLISILGLNIRWITTYHHCIHQHSLRCQ
jgi:hypothetical protein